MDTKQSELEAKLMPLLETYEVRRKGVLKRIWISCGVVVGLALLSMAVAFGKGAEPIPSVFLPLILGGVGIGIAFYFSSNGYKRDFKNEVVRSVIEAYREGIRYDPVGYVSEGSFRESGLFTKGIDRYRGEDYVTGTVDKTEFSFSEIHAEYKTTTRDSKGRRSTQWHTIFKGVFFIADFHKEFRTKTVVLPDTAEKMFGFLGQKLQSMNFLRGSLIKLEDAEFEREFCVYGDDQVEARYILSPSLMRRILELKQTFGSKIYVAFVNSKVFVGISCSRDRFEPRLFREVNDLSLIREYIADLEMIVGIVEALNLNTRIWSKD